MRDGYKGLAILELIHIYHYERATAGVQGVSMLRVLGEATFFSSREIYVSCALMVCESIIGTLISVDAQV